MKQTIILPTVEAKTRWLFDLMRYNGMNFDRTIAKLADYEFIIDQAKYDEMCEQELMSTDETVIRIDHPARTRHGDLSLLVANTYTMRKFVDRLKKYATDRSKLITDNETQQKEIYNSVVGDVFEIFVEYLIKSHGKDRRIGISNYKPVNTSNGEEDLGVDGRGVGTNGKPATVQVKFRSDNRYVLSANADGLSNFKNSSHEMYGVDFDDTENMLIVTTAHDIHHFTRDKMLNGKVRTITLAGMEKMVDNNNVFWDDFRSKIQMPKVIVRPAPAVELA